MERLKGAKVEHAHEERTHQDAISDRVVLRRELDLQTDREGNVTQDTINEVVKLRNDQLTAMHVPFNHIDNSPGKVAPSSTGSSTATRKHLIEDVAKTFDYDARKLIPK